MRFLFEFFRRRAMKLQNSNRATALVIALLAVYATVGYRHFEGAANPDLGWSDALWWTAVTMTTVGYGDLYPTTTAGRFLVAFPTMLLGVAILGYALSLLASAILEKKMKESRGMGTIDGEGHIVLVRFNELGDLLSLVEELRRDPKTRDADIVLVDEGLDELPLELADQGLRFVRGNPAREATLQRAAAPRARSILIAADRLDPAASDDRNLHVALALSELCPGVETIVECIHPENRVFFKRAGCEAVLCLSSLTNQMMVQELQDPGVHDIVAELTSNRHGRQFYVVDVPEGAESFAALREHFEGDSRALLGVRRAKRSEILPADDFALEAGDRAILIAAERPA